MEWGELSNVFEEASADAKLRQGEIANWEASAWHRPLPARGNSAASLRRDVGHLKRLGRWSTLTGAQKQSQRPASAPSGSSRFSSSVARSQKTTEAAELDVPPRFDAENILRNHQARRAAILRDLGQLQDEDHEDDEELSTDSEARTAAADAFLEDVGERREQLWYPKEVPKNPHSAASRIFRPRSAPTLLAVAAAGEAAVQRLAPHQRMKLKSMQVRDATVDKWYNPSHAGYAELPAAKPLVRQTRATLGRQAMRQTGRQRSEFACGRARGRCYSLGATCRSHDKDPFATWGFELTGMGLGIGRRKEPYEYY